MLLNCTKCLFINNRSYFCKYVSINVHHIQPFIKSNKCFKQADLSNHLLLSYTLFIKCATSEMGKILLPFTGWNMQPLFPASTPGWLSKMGDRKFVKRSQEVVNIRESLVPEAAWRPAGRSLRCSPEQAALPLPSRFSQEHQGMKKQEEEKEWSHPDLESCRTSLRPTLEPMVQQVFLGACSLLPGAEQCACTHPFSRGASERIR